MKRSSHWSCSGKTDIQKQLPEVFYKKDVLTSFAKFTAKICARLKLQASVWNFVKKETLTEEFSCEFCEIFKNIFFTEHLWTNASRYSSKYLFYRVSIWLHDQNLQKMLVKKSIFCKVAGLQPATLIKTEHVHRHNLICSALM